MQANEENNWTKLVPDGGDTAARWGESAAAYERAR